ncbi:Retrovirus-related Pol polyprotein from type-2 retrotransposable element R2DM [Labeo rohita]|uniref:Retrovirus-related Pol polyprotein from type-2 retrotransposable element R2DM n=1 Tax=Labeo rohita TaxID=84645 RepID=A0ABQ8L9R2_LABRO|nr:Retrovirus-related Pol polyprotein from type-2 retrotransposable element R2DM [Labeo rohita]
MCLANELNTFYLRFDKDGDNVKYGFLQSNTVFNINAHTVAGTRGNKSPGADNISGKALKACSVQLSGIFTQIMSLKMLIVPQIWKHATAVPVAKCRTPKVLNDFRPVALTSLVIKIFEKIHTEDPFQFAYRAGRGVEDAVTTLVHLVTQHLETSKKRAQ